MELKENNIYIFNQKNISLPTPFKGKVLEITETTIYIENLDCGTTWRDTLKSFNNKLEVIELILDYEKYIEEVLLGLKPVGTTPISFNEFHPFSPKQCNGICFCDGSCHKIRTFTGDPIINYNHSQK